MSFLSLDILRLFSDTLGRQRMGTAAVSVSLKFCHTRCTLFVHPHWLLFMRSFQKVSLTLKYSNRKRATGNRKPVPAIREGIFHAHYGLLIGYLWNFRFKIRFLLLISVWSFHTADYKKAWVLRLFVFCFVIHLGQWLEIKEKKETSKLLRCSHWYSLGSKFLFCYPLLSRQGIYFVWIQAAILEEKKNRIDGNSLKHEIVFIPSLEKLQSTFHFNNPLTPAWMQMEYPKYWARCSLLSPTQRLISLP